MCFTTYYMFNVHKGAFNNYVEKKSGWEGQWKVHDGSRDKG